MDAITNPPTPVNEPNLTYAPGTAHRDELLAALQDVRTQGPIALPAKIGAEYRMSGGEETPVVEPHDHHRVLGVLKNSTRSDAAAAISAATEAAAGWRDLTFDDRAAVLLKAADLLTGPWRQRLNAATMLGQSKTAWQAEIDAACELADFWRFNVHYGRQILGDQPAANSPGVWNRTDHRPLEGFVYAVTPFNFTAIAGNLPTAPALMGNTVIWKPSPTQQFAANALMELLDEAGMPPGVINMLPGDGLEVSDVVLKDPALAGIHFTGSTATFRHLWRSVAENLDLYRSYPRIVGETGGKDFIVAHPSADPDVLRVAMLRGAFEYQGQKCSAASRAYVPRSVWDRIGSDFLEEVQSLRVGDVSDLSNFMGAVIDRRAFDRLDAAIGRARATSSLSIAAGGGTDASSGYFVQPTVVLGDDPTDEIFTQEYFGPLLAVHVFDDSDFETVVDRMESSTPYGLTGAVIAQDRQAIAWATNRLRFTAGNFYINDKPTGAVVGQQAFGGSRASGTNDKAGAASNLLRWTSPRSIKESFVPSKSASYPHQG